MWTGVHGVRSTVLRNAGTDYKTAAKSSITCTSSGSLMSEDGNAEKKFEIEGYEETDHDRAWRAKSSELPIFTCQIAVSTPYISSFPTRAFHGRERDSTGQRRLIPDETKADYYYYRAHELRSVRIVRTLRVEFRIAPEGARGAEACSRVQRRKFMQRLPQEHASRSSLLYTA